MNSVTHKFIRKLQKLDDLTPNFDWEDIISCYTPPPRHHIHYLLQYLLSHKHDFTYKNKIANPTKIFTLAGYTPPTKVPTKNTTKITKTTKTLSTKELTQRIQQLEDMIYSMKL
jgi:hypothetical protein